MDKNQASIFMEDIAFRYGSKTVLNNFSLSIDQGKIYALIGSSGSGKTTTLRLMNGLLKPHSGNIYIDGKAFNFHESEKWRRSLGYSIQGSGLFPHMSIEENMSIIARKETWPRKKVKDRLFELCELVNLPSDPHFLNKKPREISGGQQQRVGIARALFMSPKIILMDEPFSALDPITRSTIQKEFLALQKKLSLTIVLVTHDLPEAFFMAHEIILLNNGRIEQKAKPSRFLLAPQTEYVKKFMESHSPGNVLKEIFLYSVINTDVYQARKKAKQIILKHLESREENICENLEDAKRFLKTKEQSYFYWTDSDDQFLNYQSFANNHISDPKELSLNATDHILNGMREIMNFQEASIPVINDKRKLVGVFSKGALDAL